MHVHIVFSVLVLTLFEQMILTRDISLLPKIDKEHPTWMIIDTFRSISAMRLAPVINFMISWRLSPTWLTVLLVTALPQVYLFIISLVDQSQEAEAPHLTFATTWPALVLIV